MLPLDGLIQTVDDFITKFVWAEGQTEVVTSDSEALVKSWFNLISNVVHAKIDVLQLRVLDRHPHLNCLAFFIFGCDLGDII